MNTPHHSPALPALVANLRFTVHGQSGKLWYAVKSPDKRFLRVGRKEYLIASALDGKRTAVDIVAAVQEVDATIVVSAEEVMQVVSWLSKIGLIHLTNAPATASAKSMKLSFNPIYTKIPLVDGRHLERIGSWLAPLLSWPVLVGAAALWLIAGASVLANWDLFGRTTRGLFVSDSWLWWGAAWLVLKTAHELGHAVMAVRVGSQIRSAGISLIFMAPVPYVDLSDLWTIPNRWQRILCCSGGMLVEMTLAAAAALVAVSTESQALQYFCCALATMGTVTTLAFNASPLIRFDGYFICSDLLNYPNLYTDAQLAAKQCVLKCLRPWQPARQRMSVGLVLYGLACYQYRIVMMVSLAVGTILALQGVGMALVAWGVYATLVAPFFAMRAARKTQAALANKAQRSTEPMDSSLNHEGQSFFSRHWEALLSGGVVVALCWLVVVIPSPVQPAIPGYVALRDPQLIRVEADGFLTEILISGECHVAQGDLVARLSNPELETELALKRLELARVEETMALKRAQGYLAELQAAEAQRESLALHVKQLERRVAGLQVRSPADGQLVQNDMPNRLGLFLKAGEPLATVARPEELEVRASVSQQEVAGLRAVVGESIAANISGGASLTGTLEKVEPRANDRLEQPLLAAIYGGPIPVQVQHSAAGEEELKLIQPRFDVRLRLELSGSPRVTPGQMVWLHSPGKPATLLDAFSRWCEAKWQELVRQSKPLT